MSPCRYKNLSSERSSPTRPCSEPGLVTPRPTGRRRPSAHRDPPHPCRYQPSQPEGDVEPTGAEGGVGHVDDMMRRGSSWNVAAHTATVLLTPHLAGEYPQEGLGDGELDAAHRFRGLARSHSSLAGIVLENGVWVKPKWLTHGARIMTGPPLRCAVRGRSGQVAEGDLARVYSS
jgi:hypothetical protein